MKNKILVLGILVLAIIGIIFISGCTQHEDKGSGGVAEGSPRTQQPPTLDVGGEDISDIPRYTGSVRIFYGSVPGVSGSIIVEYLTSASADTVADFYEEQLPANGWESPLDTETMRQFGLTYRYVGQAVEKEGRGIVVITLTDSEEYPGYTDINIVFNPE